MTDEKRKIGVVAATFLVAGNMMGSGVFLLPGSLAKIGTVSMWGWVVTTVGALLLAFVFAKLGRLAPKAGGPYAYARDAFGPYMGFQTNTVYWFANWIGNVALPVAAVGYFSYFIPALAQPMMRAIVVIGLIWLFTFANILGAQMVTRIQTITTSFALIPLFGIAIFGWFFFKSDVFSGAHNVSGASDFHAISSAASLTLWAFIGVESASVSAAVVKNPEKNVAIATIAGVALAAVIYISSSAVIMGMIPNDQLRVADAPFALAAQVALGHVGGGIVALCAALGAGGSLGGWILLTALSAKAAGDDGLFPKIFSKADKNDTPVQGLLIIGALMTLAVLATATSASASEQFMLITQVAVVLTLLPYIYSAVACYFVVENSHTVAHVALVWVLTSVTVLYCLWAIFGTDGQMVTYAFLFMLFITVFYPFFSEQRRRERGLKIAAPARKP